MTHKTGTQCTKYVIYVKQIRKKAATWFGLVNLYLNSFFCKKVQTQSGFRRKQTRNDGILHGSFSGLFSMTDFNSAKLKNTFGVYKM